MKEIRLSILCIVCAVVSAILITINDNIHMSLKILIICMNLSTMFMSGMNIEHWRK